MVGKVWDIVYVGIKYFLLVVGFRFLAVTGYRVTLHPLSRYPGPFLAKITGGYAVFYALLRRLHLATYLDHQKYGPVIRHGPNKLVFNSYRALHDIYQSDRTNKVDSYLITQIKADTFSIFNCLDRRLHRIKRRMISKALSEQKMRRFEPTMLQHIDICLKNILKASRIREPVNMSDRCKRLGMDIITEFSFGTSIKLQTEETNAFLLPGMAGSNYRSNVCIQAPWAKWLGVDIMFPNVFRLRMKYYLLLKRLIKDRLAEGKDAKEDLFSYVVDARDPETGVKIRMSELWSEATFFVPAGGDTTSLALSATFFYLSRNPSTYSKLASEIRTNFSTGSEIQTGPTLVGCAYLRAVIDESMRMSPPVPGTLWREPVGGKENNEPLVIDGHLVPAGTWVGVNMYTIHHNGEYFPEPFVFKPERWLNAENDQQATDGKSLHDAFSPFSVGSRACIGKAMAYMEASLALAKIIWYFDFERVQGTKFDNIGGGTAGGGIGRDRVDEFQTYDQFTGDHDGPYLNFVPRASVTKDLE